MGGFEVLADGAAAAGSALVGEQGQSVLAVGLGMVFVWSGGAKLMRPGRAGEALREFGLVRRASSFAGAAAGAYELALGLALGATTASTRLSAPAGAWALVTLLALAALQVRSLHAGQRFACFCFGSETSQLSWWTLARTLVLTLAAASLVAVGPGLGGQGTGERLLETTVAGAVLGITALLGSWPRFRRWVRIRSG
jgi:Methylamine utilisation protein MauE